MTTLFWQLNPAAPTPLQDCVYKSAARVAINNSLLLTIQSYIKFIKHTNNGSRVNPSCSVLEHPPQPGWIGAPLGAFSAFPHAAHTKPEPRLFPLTSPALLLVVLTEDAALGVGERCRVTRAMVGGLQPWRAAEERRREGRRMWEDAPPRLSLSPGRKCLVRLSSSSVQSPGGAPVRSCSVRPLRLPESSWAGSHERFPSFVASQQQQTPRFHHYCCADRQTKHDAGGKRGRNDMQPGRAPLIGWPSSRVLCHWANVVKVTGQTRNSQIQMLMK